MRFKIFILFFLALFQLGYSQRNSEFSLNNDSVLFTPEFFDGTEPLEVTLEFDIKKYEKEKSDSEYIPAKLSYFMNDSIEIMKNVRIKARGEFRRDNCLFSPYWLNLKNSSITDDSFSNINKIKVVSHCKDTKAYTDNLIKEFLAYKIYNIITDFSFKVRLLKINYIDIGRKNKLTTQIAFLIEPEDMLAERLEAYSLSLDKINYGQTDSTITTVMSMFQYLIGNTDYSVTGRHNVKILTLKDFTKPGLIPIPYDFDFSGLVNAHYARPQTSLEIKSVTTRYFYGMCRSDHMYNQVLSLFKEKEDEVFALLETFEPIDKKTRRYAINYIEEFYKEIENPRFIKNKLRSTCE